MFAEIHPADVYAKVLEMQENIDANRNILYLLCVLVCVQLLAKFAIFTRVINLLKRVISNEERTGRLLTLVEDHGFATDKKTNTLEDSARQIATTAPALTAATAEVVAKVDEGTAKVIEEVKKITTPAPGESGKTRIGNPEVL